MFTTVTSVSPSRFNNCTTTFWFTRLSSATRMRNPKNSGFLLSANTACCGASPTARSRVEGIRFAKVCFSKPLRTGLRTSA